MLLVEEDAVDTVAFKPESGYSVDSIEAVNEIFSVCIVIGLITSDITGNSLPKSAEFAASNDCKRSSGAYEKWFPSKADDVILFCNSKFVSCGGL